MSIASAGNYDKANEAQKKRLQIQKKRKKKNSKPIGKVHHRSSPGPDTRTPWEIGGISESEYKKLPPKYKKMLGGK
tara:strand:- start:447 stop:674 length:228 start_codon:yes stop_codon:yes gene_type:complete